MACRLELSGFHVLGFGKGGTKRTSDYFLMTGQALFREEIV